MNGNSFASILCDGEYRNLPISPLEAARLVAHDRGYYDMDVQPNPDYVLIVCRGHKETSFTAKGKNIQEAADAVVRRLW